MLPATKYTQPSIEVSMEALLPVEETDYSELLSRWKASFITNGHYLQVGTLDPRQGWIIDLTAIETDMYPLLKAVLPLLLYEEVPFKIPQNAEVGKALLSGALGYTEIGKIICIYPANADRALQVARILLRETRDFKGPSVPTDHCLGGIVYCRYGSFDPIQVTDQQGCLENFGYDANGNLVTDHYPIPFVLPHGTRWPFATLKPLKRKKARRLLNGRYLVTNVLKSDAKGKVMRAFSFRRLNDIHFCIVKEGVKYMSSDANGRDIQDRLRWQYQLHKALEGIIPLPKALDFFQENGNAYFVMELVDGSPMSEVINSIYGSNHWSALDEKRQQTLLQYFLTVLDFVSRLHEMGYCHRDLSPRNFMITRENKMVCIDLELAYNIIQMEPYPPFVLGTAGYMSDEQMRVEIPTAEQDIYGLGGLMVRLFTSLSPKLFTNCASDTLYNHLQFLTGQKALAALICDCLSDDPTERPALSEIRRYFKHSQPSRLSSDSPPSMEACREAIENAIACLGTPKMATSERLWFSRAIRKEKHINNESLETCYHTGLKKGVGGPLYLLAVASKAGYTIDGCKPYFSANWEYLHSVHFRQGASPGLYHGLTGTCLAFVKGVEAGLINMPAEMFPLVASGLSAEPAGIDIESGIAGQGLALLQCRGFMGEAASDTRLHHYSQQLISSQEKDGSWIIHQDGMRKRGLKLYGFTKGIAGVVYFLLRSFEVTRDAAALDSALAGLKYLEKAADKTADILSWKMYPQCQHSDPWLEYGTTGIALPFIKAYQLSGEKRYRHIAEAALRSHTARLVTPYLSTATGATGIGEVYLEAANAFQSEEWQSRAEWIVQLLLHTYQQQPDGSICWITDNSTIPTTDLLVGNAGIIHFLMRYLQPGQITLPVFS